MKHLYEFGPYCLDATNCQLHRGDQLVPLKPKVFDTLLILVQYRDQVIPKNVLMDLIWPGTSVEENNLTQNISLLRRSLGKNESGEQYIETIPKRGYRFVCPVNEQWTEADFILQENIKANVRFEEEIDSGSGDEGERESANRVPEYRGASQTNKPLRRTRRAWIVSALVLLATTTLGLLLWPSNQRKSMYRPIPLTSLPGKEVDPAFSPDGNFLAYAGDGENGDNFDIYVQPVHGGKPVRLTDDPSLDLCPAWSPDGQYIAFVRCTKSGCGIFLIPALGGAERKLHDLTWKMGWEDNYVHHMSWSRDGKFLAYSEVRSLQAPFGISLLSLEDLSTMSLTTPPPSYNGDSYPAFSPDGKFLAFTRRTESGSDIYIVPATGGEPRRVTYDEQLIIGVDWTPDGETLVFSSTRGGGMSLWQVAVSGGTPKAILTNNGVYCPALSSQGQRLAYSQSLDDTNIWQISLADPKQINKLIASTQWESGPQFAPDGQHIAFQSGRSGSVEIWICNSDGSNPQQITHFNGPTAGSPKWSPDGKKIAFDVPIEGHSRIYVVDISIGVPRCVTYGPREEAIPSWSHDGNWIYYCSNQTDASEIWKVPATGGEAVQLTFAGGIGGVESSDCKYLYYAKYNVPGIWRLLLDGGQEELVTDQLKEGDWGYWALLDDRIYFFNSGEGATPTITLESIDLSTRHVDRLSEFKARTYKWVPGLTVSPDRRTLLYTQLDQSGQDIKIIENFH